jgi:hypothetical protein
MFEEFGYGGAFHEILYYGSNLFVPALMALAAVALFAKFGGTGGGILSGIGLALLALIALFFGLIRLDAIEPYDFSPLAFQVIELVRWTAWAFVAIGIFAISKRRLSTVEAPATFVDYGPAPDQEFVVTSPAESAYGAHAPLERPG